MLEALPGLLFQPAPLGLMRAVLDDNPVVRRAVLVRGGEGRFDQPSTAEDLPSPAECVLAVVPLGAEAGCTLDIVRGSHALPEFNGAGQSRWTTPGAAAELAIAGGGLGGQPADRAARDRHRQRGHAVPASRRGRRCGADAVVHPDAPERAPDADQRPKPVPAAP